MPEVAGAGRTGPAALSVHRGLVALLVVMAFVCGGLAVALRREHARAECLRDAAEVGVDPEKCGS